MNTCPKCKTPIAKKRCRSCAGKESARRRYSGLGKKQYTCIDCGCNVRPYSKRCNSCNMRHKWTNPDERDKMVSGLIRSHPKTANRNCIDCGSPVKPGGCRCHTCATKEIWKRDGYKERVSEAVRTGVINSDLVSDTRANNPWFTPGENHPRWEGGGSHRGHAEYRIWHNSVLERDNHTCQMCGSTSQLQTHHIKSYAKHPDLRLEKSNGVTVCYDCHCTLHSRHIPKHQAYGDEVSQNPGVQMTMPLVIPEDD